MVNAVETARSWIGTKWTHKGRTRAGCDCVGLVVGVYREAGFQVVDDLDYSSGDDFEKLRSGIAAHGFEVMEPLPGDIVLFRNTRIPGVQAMLNHVGIVAGETFIHAWSTPSIMRVCETPFDRFWRGSVVAYYRVSDR